MKTEYEATFVGIDKEDIRRKLHENGGNLLRNEYMQRRVTFELPVERRSKSTWIRVRDEGDKITLTLKSVDEQTIEGQKEILVIVDEFSSTVSLLEAIGCTKKSYQESKRELWNIDGTEVSIDTWPFLDPYVEIEGASESDVKQVAQRLGFDYGDAIFGTVNAIYKATYGKSLDEQSKEVLSNFTFDIPNPFLS